MTTPDTSFKHHLTKEDLLMAGWHNIYHWSTGNLWAHPKVLGEMKFSNAACILRKRGIDKHGEMQ